MDHLCRVRPPYQNPDLPLDQRVADLLGRLSIQEKIEQLVHDNRPVERLGVPAYNWWNEACHGVGRNGAATVFPQVIGWGATWNRDLVARITQTVSDEARAKHHAAMAAGRRGQYQGLSFWTPNINIFRDPRWGRGQETFGEDPFLTGELGLATVRGLQGSDSRYLKTAACAKHYAVHSGPEQLRHGFDACPSPKDLWETYLPAFEKLVRGGVEAVMGAYNRVLGEPACGSQLLLDDILRGRWGFQGHVVSDCGAIDDFHQHHGMTRTAAESAALGIRHGCDLNCGRTYLELGAALEQKLISEAEIDRSLRRLLTTKFRLGLFDPADRLPWAKLAPSIIDSPEHRQLARQAAAESIVLLKNNGVLPLPPRPESLLIVGPTAASAAALLGSYYGVSSRLVTIAEGITAAADPSTRIEYRTGCPLSGPVAPGVNYTYPTAEDMEIVVAVLGLDHTLEGEEGDAVASPGGGDRSAIELPDCQRDFLVELRRHCRKLVLVVTGGGAIALPEAHELCDAVLQVWYPGCEGGTAVADVLFGRTSPSGKLPVTVPRRTADLPPFESYAMAGRTYRYATVEPLYPFGFGLSYARFAYGAIRLDRTRLAEGETLSAAATVTNQSAIVADEAVQCYVVPPQGRPGAPRSYLVGFEKVSVPAGGSATVAFKLDAAAFRQVDDQGARRWQPGKYQIVIGAASPSPRAQALGAPAPAQGAVELV